MLVEARVANTQEMFVVRLPLDRIFRQGLLSVLQSKRVLKDVEQRLFACQTTFPIEQEIPKASITRSRKRPDLANGRESAVHRVRFKLLARHPLEIADLPIPAPAVVY